MRTRSTAKRLRSALGGASRGSTGHGVCAAALMLAITACDPDVIGIACTLEARAAISITVVDSVTRAGIGAGATLILQEGAYRDSVTFPADQPYYNSTPLWGFASAEREGTYDVRVRRPGYQLWERRGVRVTSDQCHVNTVELEARLQALP